MLYFGWIYIGHIIIWYGAPLFALFSTALIGLVFNSYESDFQAAEKDRAVFYAQQGVEAVWSIRRQAWNLLADGTYGLTNTNGYWQFFGSSDLLENKYARTVTLADACRDGGGNLIDCPGGTIDLHTKKVTVDVNYTSINGVNNVTELVSYVTTWQSKNWLSTDWLGGAGQAIWSDPVKYDSDDGNIDYSTAGEIKLKNLAGGGCGSKIWPFDPSADYTLSDPNKIEVSGGVAQLVDQGGGGSCSGTASACNTFSTQLTCQAQAGCTWGGASGSSPACMDFRMLR